MSQQAGIELNQRSFTYRKDQGTRGHVEDPERDRARSDRRIARSTAGLTPQLFAEEMSRRTYNQTTAKIEEVEVPFPPDDLRIGAGGRLERSPARAADQPTPAVAPEEVEKTAAPSTPRAKPESFAPPGPQQQG